MSQAKLPSSRTFISDSARLRRAQKVESEIVENILTYISQENHCYTSAFSRFYQNLVVPRYWSIV